MTRLIEIQGHITSMRELLEVIGAMRSLASMRVQEAQRALPGIRHYAEAMRAAVSAALLLPSSGEPAGTVRGDRALVLCCGEHGFVGGFNERLVLAAQAELQPQDLLFVLGSRGGGFALERGLAPAWQEPMATRLASVPATIDRLEAALYPRIAQGTVSRVEVMYAAYQSGAPPVIERHGLLPLDVSAIALGPRQAPLHNLDPPVLLQGVVTEYVFALLTAAAVESITSENAARFAAMESAYHNVEAKLENLRQDANQARQGEITEELLDLIAGAHRLGEN